MIYINEWLPNPAGPDNCVNCGTGGEFVELYNKSDVSVGLNGWALKTESGKKFALAGRNIPPQGYLLLRRGETKLSLRNTDGGLTLIGAGGLIVDKAQFLGSAPEGKSFSRVDYGAAEIQHFAFVDPTPGRANKTIANTIAVRHYPPNVPLNRGLESPGFFAIMVGTAAVLAGLIIYVIKNHEDLSQLFFGGDKKAG